MSTPRPNKVVDNIDDFQGISGGTAPVRQALFNTSFTEIQISELRRKNAEEQAKNADLQKENARLLEENARLREGNTRLEEENTQFSNTIDCQSKEIDSLKDEVASLKEEYEKTVESLGYAGAQIDELVDTPVGQLQASLKKAQVEVSNLRKQVEQYEQLREDFKDLAMEAQSNQDRNQMLLDAMREKLGNALQ